MGWALRFECGHKFYLWHFKWTMSLLWILVLVSNIYFPLISYMKYNIVGLSVPSICLLVHVLVAGWVVHVTISLLFFLQLCYVDNVIIQHIALSTTTMDEQKTHQINMHLMSQYSIKIKSHKNCYNVTIKRMWWQDLLNDKLKKQFSVTLNRIHMLDVT